MMRSKKRVQKDCIVSILKMRVPAIRICHCFAPGDARGAREACVTRRRSSHTVPCASSVTLVGMGSVGMDFLASVASFPKPDDKMRTEELETQGGGNCGNALTAAARLLSGASTSGSTVRVVSKIGTDAAGDAILKEFATDNIDTSNVLVTSDKSPFTYIIVDRETNTRTCIHTPGEPYLEEEITPAQIEKILDGASAVRACIIRGRRGGESDDDAGGEGGACPSIHPPIQPPIHPPAKPSSRRTYHPHHSPFALPRAAGVLRRPSGRAGLASCAGGPGQGHQGTRRGRAVCVEEVAAL